MPHFSAGRRAVTFLGLVPMAVPTGRCGSKFWSENATLAKCDAGGPHWVAAHRAAAQGALPAPAASSGALRIAVGTLPAHRAIKKIFYRRLCFRGLF